jgi:hypothetical protein
MEIIARKIGDIRPTLYAEAPARRIVADSVVSDRLWHPGPAPRAAAGPLIAPRDAHEAWRELRGASEVPSVSVGSFQSFADGAGALSGYRAVAARPVSRIIDF